jgi:hypothetical protein
MVRRSRQLLTTIGTAMLGIILVSYGGVSLVTAYADYTGPSIGEISVSLSQGPVFANTLHVSNIVPGDSEEGTLTVKNNGQHSEWVQLAHTLSGAIFQDNGNTGNRFGPLTINGVTDYKSMDYSGKGSEFAFDNHPLQIRYSIRVNGWNGDVTPITEGPFSSDETSPAFRLTPGETASVTYTYSMPMEAHNDYQNTKGNMDIEAYVSGDIDAPPPNGNCFDPPFSNEDYSMKIGSTTPIKFENYDSNGNLITTVPSNVSLVIMGPKVGGGTLSLTYSLSNGGLTVNGGHYQANVTKAQSKLFVQESDTTPEYTASVYFNGQLSCQKSFNTYPGNRSNS